MGSQLIRRSVPLLDDPGDHSCCSPRAAARRRRRPPHRAPALSSAVIELVKAPLEREVDGTIEAVNQATVSAQTSGRVAEILYDVDDVVPAGAVIMRLKGTEQRAGLQKAQAALTEARARNDGGRHQLSAHRGVVRAPGGLQVPARSGDGEPRCRGRPAGRR